MVQRENQEQIDLTITPLFYGSKQQKNNRYSRSQAKQGRVYLGRRLKSGNRPNNPHRTRCWTMQVSSTSWHWVAEGLQLKKLDCWSTAGAGNQQRSSGVTDQECWGDAVGRVGVRAGAGQQPWHNLKVQLVSNISVELCFYFIFSYWTTKKNTQPLVGLDWAPLL